MSYYQKALRRKYPYAVTDNDDAYENPIHVVLTGPFTVHQKNLALKKVEVRVSKVLAALEWLKEKQTVQRYYY